MEAPHFGMTTGDALHLRDNAAAYQILKGVSREIPQEAGNEEHANRSGCQQVFPPQPASRRNDVRIGHRASTPSVTGPSAGTRTSLSERRVCSHETNSSLT